MRCVAVFVVVSYFLKSQTSLALGDYYVAAVVETAPGHSLEAWETYINIIKQAAVLGADIIIFPENNIYSSTNDLMTIPFNGLLKEKPVPALSSDAYDTRLVRMSEAARSNSMYVVVNLHEVLDCTKNDTEELCPEAKQYIFNTNVVFDRTGAVIHRYRKNHLFAEPTVTPAFDQGIGFFDTDFGVTFGILICFDVLNQVPWQALARNVKNLVLNVNWISELPFISAVQAHEALAYAMDVNMLVAGANNVSYCSSGSGVYSGKNGALISFMTGEPASRLLIATVPKVPGNAPNNSGPYRQTPENLDGLRTIADQSLPLHKTRRLVPGYQEFVLVYNDVTCRFKITMKEGRGKKIYTYRAGAFSGVRSIAGVVHRGFRDCAVFSCTGDAIDSCGHRFTPYIEDATAKFDELHIEGTVPTAIEDPQSHIPDAVFYPVSLDIHLLPLEPSDFEYSRNVQDRKTVHSLNLTNLHAQLYSFALWGRHYDWDAKEETKTQDNGEEIHFDFDK